MTDIAGVLKIRGQQAEDALQVCEGGGDPLLRLLGKRAGQIVIFTDDVFLGIKMGIEGGPGDSRSLAYHVDGSIVETMLQHYLHPPVNDLSMRILEFCCHTGRSSPFRTLKQSVCRLLYH